MLVVIKGAGDLASGIALRLHHSKIDVVMTDLPVPLAVRRTVAFSEAIRLGSTVVEDVKAEKANSIEDVRDCLARDVIPVLEDPEGEIVKILKPEVVVDAILAKISVGYHSAFEVEARFPLNCPQIFLFSLCCSFF